MMGKADRESCSMIRETSMMSPPRECHPVLHENVERIEQILRDALAALRAEGHEEKDEDVFGSAGGGNCGTATTVDAVETTGGLSHESNTNDEHDQQQGSLRTWATIVVESMTSPGRCYHDIHHVFQVWDNAQRQQQQQEELLAEREDSEAAGKGAGLLKKPSHSSKEEMAILAVAAVFHDVVYLSLDGNRLSDRQLDVVKPFVMQQSRPKGESSHRAAESTTTLLLRRPEKAAEEEKEEEEDDDDDKCNESSPCNSQMEEPLPCLPPCQRRYLDMVCRMFDALGPNSNIVVKNHAEGNDMSGWIELNKAASNEFLSALVALAFAVDQGLTTWQTFRLVACLEASIPFRRGHNITNDKMRDNNHNENEKSGDHPYTSGIMHELRRRWGQASMDLALCLSDNQIDRATTLACRFSAADVGAFAAPQVETFLDSTWSLLPEWFPSLLLQGGGTSSSLQEDPPGASLLDVEKALVGLLDRYPIIDPNYIFPSYRGSYKLWKRRTEMARQNLADVGQYARVRLACLRLVMDAVQCLRHCRTSSVLDDPDKLLTLRFLRRVESGVPLEAVRVSGWTAEEDDDDVETRRTIGRCLTNTGTTKRASSCPWGDAVFCHASALVHSNLSTTVVQEMSGRHVDVVGTTDEYSPGHWVWLLPVHARRLFLDSVLRASDLTNATVSPESEKLRATLFEYLGCTDPPTDAS